MNIASKWLFIFTWYTHRCRLTLSLKEFDRKEKERRKKWAKLIKQTGIGKTENKKQIK